jgi:HK97 family phage major capsid protein
MTEVLDRPADTGDDDGARARQQQLRGQYRSLQVIDARQESLRGELRKLNQSDEPEEVDLGWQGTLIQEHDDLEEIAKPLRKRAADLERVFRAAQDPGNREGPEPVVRTPDLVTRNVIGQDPFRDMDRVRNNLVELPEVRGRALDAIEGLNKRGYLRSEFAEAATSKAEDMFGQYGEQSRVAQHILETGSDEYREQFNAYIKNPQRESARAALSLTLANGGYLLPFVLDPTIILTNASSANPWRRISNVKQTTSNTWNGVNSAGVNAAWLAEGTIVTDNTPTVANIVVTPGKAAAWVFGSYEVLEDTDFGQQLPGLLADAKDRLEEAAFATGSGSGQPQGVVNGATTVVTTATTTVIALADVYAVQAALPPRFRNAPGAAWVANVAIINKIRQLDTAGGSSFWTNLGKGQPETLLGAPIYESTTMSASVATTTLEAIFGDFGQYIIVDRVGVSMIYEPLVKGTGGILPGGQAGWFMFWRVGGNLSTVNGFRVMKGA